MCSYLSTHWPICFSATVHSCLLQYLHLFPITCNGNACASMDNDIKQHCIKIHNALHTVNQSKWDILWACICFEAVRWCCYYWKKEEAMDWSLFRRKQIREKRVICSLVRACNLNSSIVVTLLESLDSDFEWILLLLDFGICCLFHSSLEYWLTKCGIHGQMLTLMAVHNYLTFWQICTISFIRFQKTGLHLTEGEV